MANEFHDKAAAIYERLCKAKHLVVATSQDDRVTARMMSCVIIDGMIYFQTDQQSDKYRQLTANPMVAMCVDNIQIEGIASVHGPSLDPQNKPFAQAYALHHKTSFDIYSSLPDTVLVKVTPTKITLWEYEGKEPYRAFFNLEKQTFSKEYYLSKR